MRLQLLALSVGLLLPAACGTGDYEPPQGPPAAPADDDDSTLDDDDSTLDDDDSALDDDDSAPDDDDSAEAPGACSDGLVHHPDDVLIQSTALAEAFCSSWNAVSGNLVVTTTPDLWALSCLCSVAGTVTIHSNSGLENLDALSQLESALGLVLVDNPDLGSVSGLGGLTSLSQDLEISGNTSLAGLAALEALEGVGGFVSLSNNPSLTDLQGLNALQDVGWYLALEEDDALSSLAGLEQLDTTGQNLHVGGNSVLGDVSALQGVASIGGDLIVTDNVTLPRGQTDALVAAIGLENIGGTVVIEGNEDD